MKKLRNYFFTGLIVVLPAVVTLYILWITFIWIDGILGDILPLFIKKNIPGLGFITTILLIMLAGVLAKNFLGKKLISLGEWILVKIPFARTIYFTTKQIVNTLLVKDKLSFKRVVLVEYPRKGIYTIGFVTNEGKGEIKDKLGQEVTSVFFPTTPNPTSGWLALIPNKDIIHLDMSIEEGVKLIISAGIIVPSDQSSENKNKEEQNIISFECVEKKGGSEKLKG
ncbi:MAG TPA: DUF502 domain-containing protein [Clostridia bacterium]|jgi:uncharacterized membrane protein|nr:DUF502 domain-containing protein [Clostridia bacterium]